MFLNRRRLLAKYEETANGTAGAIFGGQERRIGGEGEGQVQKT